MSQLKTCLQCHQPFEIQDQDLAFYQKMSPTFVGTTFPIPTPTLCPTCRQIRRMLWRNEFKLYSRKSDKSGRDIVSTYAPDSKYTVYSLDEYWADDWDAAQYAQEYDPNRSFFEQFGELLAKVPRVPLFNTKTEDCEYVNYTSECKNCYMSAVLFYNTENTHYSYMAYQSLDNSDIIFTERAEQCYFCYGLTDAYSCKYSVYLTNCRDCY
ncbi:hypothetical protein KGQ71_04050 [Patescibacteria group bacterium]|nr:hypothetical protein [Patescibacteria group bacterium]